MVAPQLLFADEHVLAVDKPAGMLVIPGRGEPEQTVRESVEAAHGKIWVVHRLDRGTTGVLLFARSGEAHRALNAAFDAHRVSKRYVAIVAGRPADEQRIDVAIAPARRGRMRPARPSDRAAKAAATWVRVVERLNGPPALAVVECVPETGRTHQIRVHLMAAGTPLAFDPDYGPRPPLLTASGAPIIARTPLHAASLAVDHPVTGKPLRIAAPLPADMVEVMERYR